MEYRTILIYLGDLQVSTVMMFGRTNAGAYHSMNYDPTAQNRDTKEQTNNNITSQYWKVTRIASVSLIFTPCP